MKFLLGVIVGLILAKFGYLEYAKDFMQWMDMIRHVIADLILSI